MILSKLFVHPVRPTHPAPKRALTVAELFAKLQINIGNASEDSSSSSQSENDSSEDEMPPPVEASKDVDFKHQQLESPSINVADACSEKLEETPDAICEDEDCEIMAEIVNDIISKLELVQEQRTLPCIGNDDKVEEEVAEVQQNTSVPDAQEVEQHEQMQETLHDSIPAVSAKPQSAADPMMGKWIHYMREVRFMNDRKLLRVPQTTLTFEKVEGSIVRTSYMSAGTPQLICLDGKWRNGERWSQLGTTALRFDMSLSENEKFMHSIFFAISPNNSDELIEKEVNGSEYVSIRYYKRVLESPPAPPQPRPTKPSTPKKPDTPTPYASPLPQSDDDDDYQTPEASPRRPTRNLWSGGQARFH